METPQDGVEASLGTQLLTKPVSQGETGKSSVLRPGGAQREHKELLGQISVQQEGRGPVKPIQEERTEHNDHVADTVAGATFSLQTDQNEKLEILRPYQQLQSQEFRHFNTLEPNEKVIARMSVDTETIGTGKYDRQDSRFKL